MRFISSHAATAAAAAAAACALLAITCLANSTDALDLFIDESPWTLLGAHGNRKSPNENAEQVFMRCDACVGLATSLASGEDTLTLPLPHHDGTISRFTLQRTTDDVIGLDLQAQFPDAQTYYGRNNMGVSVEVDITVDGGVRVQYHGAQGELSYLDHVRDDDTDLALTSDDVREAMRNVPVFRVYKHVRGRRASDVLESGNNFTCSTTTTHRGTTENIFPNLLRRLQSGKECGEPNYIGDGFCDPLNNRAVCEYDGGDCCSRSVKTQYCTASSGGGPDSEACSCLDPSFSDEPNADGCITGYIGDGICDANNNNVMCGNDAQDCCGVFADKTLCEGENCNCPGTAEFYSFPGQTYRIAIGTSKKYSAYHGNTVGSVLSEVLTAVNRVGGIYKRSLNIGLQLFGNTTQLFEIDGVGETLLDEQGNAIANGTAIFQHKLGSVDGFDIGHILFSTGNSRIIGKVCTSTKAHGGTGSPTPVADGYYIDFLAHEIGHQLSAGHTWTGLKCAAGQFVQGSSVEPGSGATIMGYAGLCGTDNIKARSNPYFSLISLEEIRKYTLNIFEDGICGLAAPDVIPPKIVPQLGFPQGQKKCQVPKETGFVLAPQVSDVILNSKAGVRLSYSWEQADLGTTAVSLGVYEFGPIFRSQVPINKPVRYFPSLSSRFSTNSVPGEPQMKWPDRNFRFSLTIRDTWQLEKDSFDDQEDLGSGRGSYAAGYVEVSVSDAGPFELEKVESAADGTTITVAWSTQAVASLLSDNGASSFTKVSLSYDNGATFGHSLLSKFADGQVTMPIEACPGGLVITVLAEVESVTGCSFYAVKSSETIICPSNLTTEQPSSSGSPTKLSTISPMTAAVPHYPTVEEQNDNQLVVIFAGSGAGVGLIVVVAAVVFGKRNGPGATFTEGDLERGQIVSLPPKSEHML